MALFTGIVGDTGSGKSRSIVNLDPESTVIFNVLRKELPFKGASKYVEGKNMFYIQNYEELKAKLVQINSGQKIKTIVIDDMRFLMIKEFFSKALETGYTKFTVLAKNFQTLLELISQLKKGLYVFGFLHDEDVTNDKIIVSKKLKLIGKLLDEQYNPIETMTICLWCKPEITKDTAKYQFITNRCLVNGIEIPAKSPEGMFVNEEGNPLLNIPNDLALVVKAIEDYF